MERLQALPNPLCENGPALVAAVARAGRADGRSRREGPENGAAAGPGGDIGSKSREHPVRRKRCHEPPGLPIGEAIRSVGTRARSGKRPGKERRPGNRARPKRHLKVKPPCGMALLKTPSWGGGASDSALVGKPERRGHDAGEIPPARAMPQGKAASAGEIHARRRLGPTGNDSVQLGRAVNPDPAAVSGLNS